MRTVSILALLVVGAVLVPTTAWAAGPVSQSAPQGGFIGGLPSSPFELPSSAVQAAPPPIQQQSPLVPALPPPPVSAPTSAPAASDTGAVNPLCIGLTPAQQAAIPLCQQSSQ